jgi:glycosyltransferase involved in cell wall biosynthesis
MLENVNNKFDKSVEENVVNAGCSTEKIAIVIPTLNEVKAVGKVLDGIKDVMGGYSYQMLVVDGRSVDGTEEVARRKGVSVIYQLGRGYGNALKTGFSYAKKQLKAKVIVMMDADLSYDSKDIPELVEPILGDEADLVIGNRFKGMHKGAMPFVNRVGNRFLSLMARIMLRLSVHDTQCGMRAFKSEVVDSGDMLTEGMPFAIEMLAEAKFAGARISEVPLSYRPRVGETKLNPISDGLRILGTILRLSRNIQP